MDVSVIIVNYHTSAPISNCLKSILEKTNDLQYEIIIVDNNSEPDLKEIILSNSGISEISDIHFLNLKQNLGFGGANNEGIKIAQGRNILFLNPDTLIQDNAIKILSDFLDNHSEAGACGGNLMDSVGNLTFSYRRYFPGLFWEIDELFNNIPQKIRFGNNRTYNLGKEALQVGYISGADLMVKKKILDEIGSFSTDYFMYYDDVDLCLRIRKEGWKIYNIPDAGIIHLESKSFKDTNFWQSRDKTRFIEESRHIYYRRNASEWEKKMFDIVYSSFLNSRIIFLKKGRKKEYYKLRREYFNRYK